MDRDEKRDTGGERGTEMTKKRHAWRKTHMDGEKGHGWEKRDKCGKRLALKRKERNRTPRNMRGELGTRGTGGKRDNENTNKNLPCEDSALTSKGLI
jgi:hypothetical protein